MPTFLSTTPSLDAPSHWGKLYGASFAHALVQHVEHHGDVACVIARDSLERERLEHELKFFAPKLSVLSLPGWEVLPYDPISPHPDLVSTRLATIAALPTLKHGVILTTLETSMQRLCPPSHAAASHNRFTKNDVLDLDHTKMQLQTLGYTSVSQVEEPGEFAVRGSLIDIFPSGRARPFRIDLLDDTIESIRNFDPDTQRSEAYVNEVSLLPAREYPFNEQGINHFRQMFRRQFAGNPTDVSLYSQVSEGQIPAGIEHYLPLFFEHLSTVFEVLPVNTTLFLPEDAEVLCESYWQSIGERYESRRHDVSRPVLEPDALYLPPDDWQTLYANKPSITVQAHELPEHVSHKNFHTHPAPNLRTLNTAGQSKDPRLLSWLEEHPYKTLIAAESPGRRERVLEWLQRAKHTAPIVYNWDDFINEQAELCICVAPLDRGFIDDDQNLALITTHELFSRPNIERRKARQKDPAKILRDLAELDIGAPVVHEHYGVGRYQGLERMQIGNSDAEFLVLSYADNDKIYVPVLALHLISRYVGADADHAPLHQLGSGQWEKARKRAAKRVRDVAAELLDLYARREARGGTAIDIDEDELGQFVQGFSYEATPDQAQAIDEVLADLKKPAAMDRVVCGDVGFGKTEVALRAAFAAAMAGQQVAILVPTTLLAAQHVLSFKDRFADWPIKIGELSRFKTAKETKQTLEELANGKVDIVIGTHKLVQPGTKFKNLGLVVIDEEHRFGVRHKEALKSLREEVDVLTLTATPIPRTLNLSLGGIRDISIIATPPPMRIAIKTLISEWNDALLRDACIREFKRGGQIYFVHNNVQTIHSMADTIQTLVPEANIRIAHGQMPERELEQVMLDFNQREFNVLLCTTIVESGLDVPTANTIIINKADRFGLAQLHQLRGRVGRAHHLAYAYLVTPPKAAMTDDAIKRLEAIESSEELGAGFVLATHDLEIRGAGELLGEKQSGQIHEIGFSLYLDMLKRTVDALKRGEKTAYFEPLSAAVELNLNAPAFLPDEYLPDVELRLRLYKRIASADVEELTELKSEMIDRFGVLPETGNNLIHMTLIKRQSEALGVIKIDAHATGGRLVFSDKPSVEPATLLSIIEQDPELFQLQGSSTLQFRAILSDTTDRLDFVLDLLKRLS